MMEVSLNSIASGPMKKCTTIIIILLAVAHHAIAQDPLFTIYKPDDLSAAKDDTSRVWAMVGLSDYYKGTRPDSALTYAYKGLELARKIKFRKGEFEALEQLILTQGGLGNDSKSLQLIYQADKLVTKDMQYEKAILLLNKGAFYEHTKNYMKALDMYKEAKKIFDSINDSTFSPFAQLSMGKMYLEMHRLDLALYHCEAAYKNAIQVKDNWVPTLILLQLGRVQDKLGNTDLALSYFRRSLANPLNTAQVCACYLNIAQLYQRIGNRDSAISYGDRSLALARKIGLYNDVIDANLFLSAIHESKDLHQALLYSKNAISYKDSLHDMAESATQETFADLDEQARQQEIEDARAQFKNRLQVYAFIGVTFTLLIIASFLYRSSRLKQRAKQNIEGAYAELKATQAQLIQSEKMASLGELTAGIAHEIQNPLNFVNNFSEVNGELIKELKREVSSGNMQEVTEIADDIEANSEKINHHGKRADAIVKGMLQHSRSSSGTKEPSDINRLADEYLRLAYQGFRARDKSFNATFRTEFDSGIDKVNIVPQEMGRVILNLINNAFYAVNERAKQRVPDYEPTVVVATRRLQDRIEIKIKDNGNGIAGSIKEKLFQPFFTTKPTGQGTGLGLSLAYDIIKAHRGEIKVETSDGEGSEFIIQIPS